MKQVLYLLLTILLVNLTSLLSAQVTATLEGNVFSNNSEADIRIGGDSLRIVLSNDHWIASIGENNDTTSALINSLSGNRDWGAVKVNIDYTNIERLSDTLLLILLPAAADYDIYADETVSLDLDERTLQSETSNVTGANTLTITHDHITASITTNKNDSTYFTESEIRSGTSQIIITVLNDTLSLDVGGDNGVSTALINSMSGDQQWAVIVDSLDFEDIDRISNTEIHINIPVSDYFIAALETVDIDLPDTIFQNYTSNVNVSSAFTVENQNTTLTVTGSIQDGTANSEDDIINGGSTITLTLVGNEWDPLIDAGGTETNDLLGGITGSTSWNDDVIGTVTPTVSTNGKTEITITFPAAADYSISTQDVISISVPENCFKWSESSAVDGNVNLYIDPSPEASINDPGLTESNINGNTLTLTLKDETFNTSSLIASNFSHNGGTYFSITNALWQSDTEVILTLGLNADFDVNITNFKITAEDYILTAGNALESNGITIIAIKEPHINSVEIPAGIYKIGDVVPVNISVVNDPGQTYDALTGTVANQSLENLTKQADDLYTGYFTVDEFETDYASGDIIPVVDLRLNNGSIIGDLYNTDINNPGDVIDAHRPLINNLQATSTSIKKIGDVVDIIISCDEGFYSLVKDETFVNGVSATSLNIELQDYGTGFYILHYTISENDGDVPVAGTMTAQIKFKDIAGNESDLKSTFLTNTVRIDSKPPDVSSMTVIDGNYSIGDTIIVSIAADGNNYTATNETIINGISLASTFVWFSNEGSNNYKLFYKIRSTDSEVSPNALELELYLKDAAGNISSPFTNIELNSLAIYTNLPTAVLSGNQQICEDDLAKLTVNLTGNSPWTIYISDGSNTSEYAGISESPFEFYVNPVLPTNNYLIELVRDVNSIENTSVGSVTVKVNKKTDVNIININSSYSVEDDPVPLEADSSGGTFFGNGVIYTGSVYKFDPGLADTTGSPHTIYYNYTNSFGCHSADSVEIYVKEGRGTISIPKTTYCDYENSFTATATNDVLATGWFYLLNEKGNQVLGLVDHHNNTATISPGALYKGTYTILYQYPDIKGATLSLREDFDIQSVPTPKILTLDKKVFCQNEASIELKGDIEEAIFFGNGVSGSVNNGFKFNPQTASVGNNTISYRYTIGLCFSEVSEVVDVKYIPQINFTESDQCVGGNDTIYFTNTTPNIVLYKPLNWKWTFGDINSGPANTSTQISPFHKYTGSGLRNIEVMGETIDGCRDTLKRGIDFGIKPNGKIRWLSDCFVSGELIDFEFDIDQAVTMDTYEWTFFDSPTDSTVVIGSDNAQHSFPAESKYPIRLYLETSIGCSRTISDTLTLKPTIIIGEQGYEEDFNNSDGIWAVEGADNTEYVSWNYGLSQFSALGPNNSNAWFTVLPNDPLTELSAIVSPCFDFRGLKRPMVTLDIFRSLENNREGAVLEYSVDNKETWQEVGSLNDGLNWFNSFQIRNELEDQQFLGWTGVQPFTPDASWILAKHHLDYVEDYPNVRFRILFASDHSSVISGREGFGFDNFRINSRTRKVVLEHFTNMSKSGIASIDETVNNIYAGNFNDLVKLEYHTNFNGPDQFNADNPAIPSTRAFYYGINAVPYSLLDGGGVNDELIYLYVNPASYLNEEDVNLRALIDPLFDIDLDVSLAGQELTVNFSVTAKEDLPAAERIIQTVVFERHIADVVTPYGVNDFYNVVKTMLPDAAGKAEFNAWSANESKSYQYTWPLNNVDNKDSLRVAVFIQSDDTKEIYQAATNDTLPIQGFTSLRRTQVNELEMLMYPNPASDFVQLRLAEPGINEYRIEIYDQVGKLIKQEIWNGNEEIKNITLSSIKSGIYFIRLKDEDGLTRSLKKLVIIKR
jgi:Secretion system C-terminal sorting domain